MTEILLPCVTYMYEKRKREMTQALKKLQESSTFNPFPIKPLSLSVCSTSLENTVGKGETAHTEQFPLFPVFSILLQNFLPFSLNLKVSHLQTLSLWNSLKLVSLKLVIWERVN